MFSDRFWILFGIITLKWSVLMGESTCSGNSSCQWNKIFLLNGATSAFARRGKDCGRSVVICRNIQNMLHKYMPLSRYSRNVWSPLITLSQESLSEFATVLWRETSCNGTLFCCRREHNEIERFGRDLFAGSLSLNYLMTERLANWSEYMYRFRSKKNLTLYRHMWHLGLIFP